MHFFMSVCLLYHMNHNRRNILHIWHAYSTNGTLSNNSKVKYLRWFDLYARIVFSGCSAVGDIIFYKHVLFKSNMDIPVYIPQKLYRYNYLNDKYCDALNINLYCADDSIWIEKILLICLLLMLIISIVRRDIYTCWEICLCFDQNNHASNIRVFIALVTCYTFFEMNNSNWPS